MSADPQPLSYEGASPFSASHAPIGSPSLHYQGELFGHKLVYIPGKGSYIDASTTTDQALFPYKGLHTLRTVQFIAVAVIAALAAIIIAASVITSGGATVLGGILIGIAVGASIDIAGSLAVHFCNTSDPIAAARERKTLLDKHISSPGSSLLTDAEKAHNFSSDHRLSPLQAKTHFEALARLPGFKCTKVLAEENLRHLNRIHQNLLGLDRKLQARLALPRVLRDRAHQEEELRYQEDTTGARTAQLAGLGGLVAGDMLGDNLAGSLVRAMGAGAVVVGGVSAADRHVTKRRNQREIDHQYEAAAVILKESMHYDERRAASLSEAQIYISNLQTMARTQSGLSRSLPL